MPHGPTGIADLPGFEASLRLLIEVQQYSVTDVGMMFNVSRERMRQLCNVYKVQCPGKKGSKGLNAVRIWDDNENQFKPYSRKEINDSIRSEQQAQREYNSQKTRAERRAAIAQAYYALRNELGTTPTIHQWAERVRGKPLAKNAAGPTLVNYWGAEGGAVRGMLSHIRRVIGAPAAQRGPTRGPRYRKRSRLPVTT